MGQTANCKLGCTVGRSDARTCYQSRCVPVTVHIKIIRYYLVCLLPNLPLNTFHASTSARKKDTRKNFCTDDTTTATLSDHLLRSMLIAQECATGVGGHQAVKVLDGRCAQLPFRGRFSCMIPVTHNPETADRIPLPRSRPSSSSTFKVKKCLPLRVGRDLRHRDCPVFE